MTAVTIENVDQALLARYAGISIDVAGTPTTVESFIEEPSTEEYPERVYPSITLKLIAINFDETRGHSDDDEEEEIAYNDGLTPPERTMRLKPSPFLLTYSLDTWHRVMVGESRDLVGRAFQERTHPRGSVDVTDVDGGTESCWVMWVGGVTENDERENDYVIYHKTLTINVLVDLLTDPSTSDVKV
ncbi:MAG: hypothetical protein ACXADB_14450, partial [Candidatus Hermodarchaeia archaeon]